MEIYNGEFVPRPFGLANTGSICYFNSLMQSLLSCPAFASSVSEDAETGTALAYESFVRSALSIGETSAVDQSGITKGSIIVLKALLGDISTKRRFKFGNGQECASEAFIYFSEAIGEKFQDLFAHAYSCDVFCPKCDKVVSTSRDSSTQLDLFFLTNEFIEAPTSGADANAIKDPTPWGISRRDFITQIMYHKQRLDDYVCPECHGKDEKIRIYKLARLPDILVCIFDIYGFKHPRPVVPKYFPEDFTVPAKDGGKLYYKLVAQIEHFGSMFGGHYVARGLRKDGKVFNFNDMSVSEGAFSPTPNTYMIMYHIVDCPDRFAKGASSP